MKFPAQQLGQQGVAQGGEGGGLVDADQLVFLKHKKLRSPMRSHVAAFRDKASAQSVLDDLGEGGVFLSWEDIMKEFPTP